LLLQKEQKVNKLKFKKYIDYNNLKNTPLVNQKFISFAPNLYLKLGKMHEICGPARIRIAILVAAKTADFIVWIRPNWENFIMNTDGISDWFSPSQLLFVNAKNRNDLFSTTEELLRSGISTITITELPVIPSSLQMRRINLAMASGIKLNNSELSLGLILSPNKGGATSIESRWYASTLPCWGSSINKDGTYLEQKWYVKRLFSRTDPIKEWTIETNTYGERNKPPKLISLPIG